MKFYTLRNMNVASVLRSEPSAPGPAQAAHLNGASPRYARPSLIAGTAALLVLISACTPTVEVKAPDKPIEINLNVNIEHRVKVEIEKDVKQAMAANPGIF